MPVFLSPADVLRLYGDRIFIVPDEKGVSIPEPVRNTLVPEPVVTIPQAPAAAPAPVQEDPLTVLGKIGVEWKMKPQATLALILPEATFNDRALTGKLREWIVSAGIDTASVGFGVIKPVLTTLADMPVPKGLIFGGPATTLPSPARVQDQLFIFLPSLESLAASVEVSVLVAALQA
ncbi:MAG: hypothetical protein SF053_04565 [Bacteroidia bacterium]|nr:hypothetical protein [Bacteroidia bacterium]